jgi:hypothetical protein
MDCLPSFIPHGPPVVGPGIGTAVAMDARTEMIAATDVMGAIFVKSVGGNKSIEESVLFLENDLGCSADCVE